MTASSKQPPKTSPHSRFIPREEIAAVAAWSFSAMDVGQTAPAPTPAPVEAEPAPAAPAVDIDALLQEARQQAYAEGFQHGHDAGSQETRDALEATVRRSAEETAVRMGQLLHSMGDQLIASEQRIARQILELSCDIARQVVRQELSVNPNALQPVVREAVGMLVTEGRPATVRLNPIDMDAMAQPLREELDGPGVQWMADAAVPVGGCLVESAGTVVDGSLDKRWQRAIAALGLQSPWSEGDGDER